MEEKDKNLDDSFLFNEKKQPEFGDSLFQEQPQIADEFSFLDNDFFCKEIMKSKIKEEN